MKELLARFELPLRVATEGRMIRLVDANERIVREQIVEPEGPIERRAGHVLAAFAAIARETNRVLF